MTPVITAGAEQTAAFLRTALNASGLSQGELARRTGIAKPQISRYLNAGADPTTHQLRRMLSATGYELVAERTFGTQARQDGEVLFEVLSLIDYLPRRSPSPHMSVPSFTDLVASHGSDLDEH